MENTLFLQSEVKDPYEIYSRMLVDHPLYYDRTNNIWAVYSYDDCIAVLSNSMAYIPKGTGAFTSESDETKIIIENLARLNNPPHHALARKASSDLLSSWRFVDSANLIHCLIGEPKKPATIDWVSKVSKKLPALYLLKGFNFSSSEIDLILPEIEELVKLMLPTRSAAQNTSVNKSVASIFSLIDSRVSKIYNLKAVADIHLYSSNLIGLLIQSYDAGRGLISNSLVQLLKEERVSKNSIDYFERSVRETLRFDPPVHNTRRILNEQMVIHDQLLSAGENILIVLAAANRDPKQFKKPDTYNIYRNETPQFLSYGAGGHRCIAEHFSAHLAVSVLHYLYSKYDRVKLLESEIQYEPRVNVRLPVKMHLVVS